MLPYNQYIPNLNPKCLLDCFLVSSATFAFIETYFAQSLGTYGDRGPWPFLRPMCNPLWSFSIWYRGSKEKNGDEWIFKEIGFWVTISYFEKRGHVAYIFHYTKYSYLLYVKNFSAKHSFLMWRQSPLSGVVLSC